jgi:hypothetical protein
MEIGNKRGNAALPGRQAIRHRGPVHRPLGVEHPVDAPHGLGGQRRAGDLGQLEHLAPEMRPTRASMIGPGVRLAR